MEVLIVFAALGVLGLIVSRRWRQRVILPMALVILLYVLFTAPMTLDLALKAFVSPLPQDTGERVDAIVILGRGEPLRHQRVEVAVQQWKTGRSPKIFASGRLDALPMVADLKNEGIPTQTLSGEECSLTTEENGLFTATILDPQRYQKILLITDAPHMLRSFLVFQRFGYSPIPRISNLASTWSAREKARVVMREFFGLVGYGLAGRLKAPPRDEFARSHQDAVQKVTAWKCQV